MYILGNSNKPDFVFETFDSFKTDIDNWKKQYNEHPQNLIENYNDEMDIRDNWSLQDGKHKIVVDEVKFDCFLHKGNEKKLYVILSGGILKGTELPHFERWSYCSILKGTVLIIDDPMLSSYSSQQLCVGWYYGNHRSYIELIANIVEKIVDLLAIEKKNVICYGSSAGGYGAIFLSSIIEESKCVAINPQINLKIQRDWINSIEMERITGHDLSSDDLRNDLRPLIQNSLADRIVIVENAMSDTDMIQCKSLCDYMSVTVTYGLNKISDKILVWIYDALPINSNDTPHGSQELRSCIYSVLGLLDIDMSQFDKYKDIYLSISLMWSELYKKYRDCLFWINKANDYEKNIQEKSNEKVLSLLSAISDYQYYQGKFNSITKIQTDAFINYKNIHCGKDVVLLATGPSLKNFVPLDNCIYCGVNKAFTYSKVHLDYLFMVDYNATKDYIKNAEKYKCKKFYGIVRDLWEICIIPESIAISANASRFYLEGIRNPIHFTHDICNEPLGDSGSAVFSAMQFLLWTNPKRIYLVGCDTTNGGHFDENYENSTLCKTVYDGWCAMKKFATLYYPDTEIISINPVGLRGMFKDIDQ